MYIYVCGYPLQLQAIIMSNLLILVRYQLRHFICLFAVVVCVCVGGIVGRRTCNSRCHWDWLKEQFGTAGLYLQNPGWSPNGSGPAVNLPLTVGCVLH